MTPSINVSEVVDCIRVEPVIACGPVDRLILEIAGCSITVRLRSKGYKTSSGLLYIKYNNFLAS